MGNKGKTGVPGIIMWIVVILMAVLIGKSCSDPPKGSEETVCVGKTGQVNSLTYVSLTISASDGRHRPGHRNPVRMPEVRTSTPVKISKVQPKAPAKIATVKPPQRPSKGRSGVHVDIDC